MLSEEIFVEMEQTMAMIILDNLIEEKLMSLVAFSFFDFSIIS